MSIDDFGNVSYPDEATTHPNNIRRYIGKYFKNRLLFNSFRYDKTNLELLERLHELETALDRLGIKL